MQDGSSENPSISTTNPPQPSAPVERTGEIKRPPRASIFSGFLSLLTALAVVLAVRSMFFEPFKIPSGSMMPTLLRGDHIFVKKYAYTLHAPFTDFFGPGVRLAELAAPQRGDIIVFRYPKDPSTHYIKRVIGLPGEKIQLKNKQLLINDQPIVRAPMEADAARRIMDGFDDAHSKTPAIEFYNEKLGSVDHVIMIDHENFMAADYGPVTVPQNSLFVMGDNRDRSNDSRFWGFVPMENVTGKAMFIWMSFFYDRTDSSAGFHPERIGINLK